MFSPRVGVSEVKDFNDVQRMYILLSKHEQRQPGIRKNHRTLIYLIKKGAAGDVPEQTPSFFRFIRIGKKRLPSTSQHNRFWGIIEEATDDISKIQVFF